MTQQEYIRRRQSLLAKMAPASAALIFASPEVTRSADTKYPYRQNSNFWYFTGFNEPQALLILFKRDQSDHHHSVLFNRMSDKIAEIWTGCRLGQEAAPAILNVDWALPWDDITNQLHLLLNGLNVVYHAQGEYSFADCLLFSALDRLRCGARQKFQAPVTLVDWRPWVHDMRLIKSEEELAVMRRACEITSLAHTRAMQQCKPGMYEYQLEGEIQYEFTRHGARFPSYNIIVGSGENSCILHYTENADKIKSGDLVLIDAGCEYQGYASDITRTFPVNGNFSPEQRAVYNIVLAMFNHLLAVYRPGLSILEVNNNEKTVHIMVTGLVQLGVMKGDVDTLIAEQAHRQFLMHKLSHWLGLDVHDVSDYGSYERNLVLEPGMVLTIEPGIYIAADADVPATYRGIGIRIEDNIVITPTGNENLTVSVVKEANAIEALMAAEC